MLDQFGPALQRLARSYEEDPPLRADLVQEIYVAPAATHVTTKLSRIRAALTRRMGGNS